LFRLVEGIDEGFLARTGNLTDELRGKDPARHGGPNKHFTGGRAQTIQPLTQH
jgi:hypothetical protein